MPLLNWLNRDDTLTAASRAPYRLLQAVPEHSYGDPNCENMLIQGDNLDGLKALLPYYAGKVKCIYIDPLYNTRSAYTHYDNNLSYPTSSIGMKLADFCNVSTLTLAATFWAIS